MQKFPKKSEIFPAPSYKTWAKKYLPPTKKYFRVGGVYTMENKDANADYLKVVGVGDLKWEIVEIRISISFFFAWDLYSQFFIQGVFKSHLKKITPT